MSLDRRRFLALASAALPALAQGAPRLYRRHGEAIPYRRDVMGFIESDKIQWAAAWRYQTIDPATPMGIVVHEPTGFAFLTFPEANPPPHPLDDMHDAVLLFGPDDAPGEHLAARRVMARAAGHMGATAEHHGGGALRFPLTFHRSPFDPPYPIRPFAAPHSRDPALFWLRA